jgi:GT2 family glycosyltransferase
LDDGSNDKSWDVLQKYKSRVILERHKNIGEPQTVNKGFLLAKGEFIGVVNSDDPLLPGAVKKIVQYFRSHRETIVVYPDWEKIDEKGRIFEKVRTPDYDYEYILKTFHCVPGPGTFFRKSVVDKLAGRDARFKYVSDFDFWLRAGLIGPFARLPEILATFRVHSGSASVNSLGGRMSQEHIDLAKKIYALADFPESLKKFKNETFSSAYFLAWWMSGKRLSFKGIKYLLISFFYHPKRYFLLFENRAARLAKRTAKKLWFSISRKSA